MPFNSAMVASMAEISAELWQRLACLPERISSGEMLELAICFPLQQLGRWALYFWTYLCVSPHHNRHLYDDDFDEEDSDDGGGSGHTGGALASSNTQY